MKFFCHSMRCYIWKPVWYPMWTVCENMCERVNIVSHPFNVYFTKQNFTCMWNMYMKFMWKVCEKRLKRVWKLMFFHMMFHIHTPSNVVQGDNGMLPILSSSSKRNRRKLKPGSAKQFRMIVQRWRTTKSPFKVKLPPVSMMQTNF